MHNIYYIFTACIIVFQTLMIYQSIRAARFILRKSKEGEKNDNYKAALICPCKGIDTTFERNMNTLFNQNHDDYKIVFVVEDKSDQAYQKLLDIIQNNKELGSTITAEIVIAGLAKNNSQKVHNLLAAILHVKDDCEVFVFVDSDAFLPDSFLRSILKPLKKEINIVSTGYRWFVPEDDKWSSHTLSAINAYFAGILGQHKWNCAWGGAMAILKEDFYSCKIDQIWQGSLADDYSLTWAVKKYSNRRVYFMPKCLLPSFEKTTWKNLFGFAKRQLVITRCCMNYLWWMVLGAFTLYLFAFWGGLAATIYLAANSDKHWILTAILPVVIYLSGVLKAVIRQSMASKLYPELKNRLTKAALLDIYFQPFINSFTFAAIIAAGFTRSISWRNKKYTILSIDKTKIEQH